MFDLEENLRNLPDRPGVYIHKDKEGEILYIGKAISLKKRVRQYFQSTRKKDPKMRALTSHIAEFEYIVTDTEIEALLLENSLIKRHMPKYNVLLRDDKTFPYIKITLQDEWPRLVKTRRIVDDGSRYFGPYTDAAAVEEIIELLSEIFLLKRCSVQKFSDDWRPCLNHHLGLCNGYCMGGEDPQAYAGAVEKVVDFLGGDTSGVRDELQMRMERAAVAMEYEAAALFRDRIIAIDSIPDQEKLEGFLLDVKRNRVKVVRRQAEALAKKREEKEREWEEAWRREGVEKIDRIEAYDISHIAGSDAVGAMTVFQGSVPLRKEYRKFRIRLATGGDDADSLKEVLERRLKRAAQGDRGFSILPDLLLIDGGRAQVSAVKEVVAHFGLSIPVAGMVKDERHRTRELLYEGRRIGRRENPVLLRHVGRIQEETHRFAIDYLRGIRSKRMKYSALDQVPGIGIKRKEALLKTFGSVKAVAAATEEDLAAVKGMSRPAAKAVRDHLNNSIVEPEKE